MINFNCKIKNRQTQTEGRGHEIQIWGHNRQIQIGAGGQGWRPGPEARKQKIPKTNATNKYTCQEKVF